MKLGVHLGYWGPAPPTGVPELLRDVEQLGFDAVFAGEAWGSDALSPLAWWGSATTRLRLGTAVMQMSARTPTATAMAALTMDHLSEGRFVLGLGVSGPRVVEGWYGQPFDRPLARTREYVDIVRQVLARVAPVTSSGPHHPLPLLTERAGGRALRSITHPRRADLPVFLGAHGPRNVALAAEIADGWLPVFFAPRRDAQYRALLEEGFARRRTSTPAAAFEVLPSVPVVIDDDVERAADRIRPTIAFYAGAMGADGQSFHFDHLCRIGFEAEATRVRDLYLEGRHDDAVAAVPTRLVEEISLIGPAAKVRAELEIWEASVATTLLLGAGVDRQTLRMVAELVS